MLSRRVGTMQLLEVEVTDAEIAKMQQLARSAGVPPELYQFISRLFPPPCFAKRDQIDINKTPCSECVLSEDCVAAANAK